MDLGTVIKVIEAITPCFQALIWPFVLVFILIFLRAPLKKFLGNISEFTLKAGTSGLEATAKRQQIEAATYLGAAQVSDKDGATDVHQLLDEEMAQNIVNVVSEVGSNRTAQLVTNASILWVDDRPESIMYLKRSFEAVGIQVTIRTSTDDALEQLRLHKYDLIITDMKRGSDPQAAYTLLEELKKQNINIPVILYSGAINQADEAEAFRRGAYASINNNPEMLFGAVIQAIEYNLLKKLH